MVEERWAARGSPEGCGAADAPPDALAADAPHALAADAPPPDALAAEEGGSRVALAVVTDGIAADDDGAADDDAPGDGDFNTPGADVDVLGAHRMAPGGGTAQKAQAGPTPKQTTQRGTWGGGLGAIWTASEERNGDADVKKEDTLAMASRGLWRKGTVRGEEEGREGDDES